MENETNFLKNKLFIVHGGRAHRDDFLCACFGLTNDATVERRDPTPAELEDPNVIICDVGGQYDPGKNNFDHHLDEFVGKPVSAFSLLMKKFRPRIFEVEDWFEMTSGIDNCGPRWAYDAGCSKEAFQALRSPIEGALLEAFSDPHSYPHERLYIRHAMIAIWLSLFSKALALSGRAKFRNRKSLDRWWQSFRRYTSTHTAEFPKGGKNE